MAQQSLTISVETSLAYDAINHLHVAHERLARRHGAAARLLERRIEALLEGGAWGEMFEMPALEPGWFMLAPTGELSAVLQSARRVGVLS